ncbi:MAG: GNAT family N-acetyltransferase [Croceibacterium sp.]
MMRIERISPRSPQAISLLQALSDTLARITGSSGAASFAPEDVEQDGALFLLAFDEAGKALGCGAFRPLESGIAEIKRMYASPGTRGVGAALLAALEEAARDMGYTEAWCETRLVNERAVRFYESHGYVRIENFGKYRGRSEAVCFGKRLFEA